MKINNSLLTLDESLNLSEKEFNSLFSKHINKGLNSIYKILGLSKKDAFNQYLAYHEGHSGWQKKSFKSKKWLIKAAMNVEINTNKYNTQLKQCEKQLNKNGLFGIL